MEKKCGIYLITFSHPGRLPSYYVGQSRDTKNRIKSHKCSLKSGTHSNPKLQRYWSKYGAECFKFEVLEEVEYDLLNEAEKWWLSEMVPHNRCFNISMDPVNFALGLRQSEDHIRKRIRAGEQHYLYGKEMKPSHRDAISRGGLGLKRSASTKEKISAANKAERNCMFGKTGAANKKSKAVIGTSVRDGKVISYASACLAEKDGFHQETISRACHGKIKVHKGYTWRFAIQNPA